MEGYLGPATFLVDQQRFRDDVPGHRIDGAMKSNVLQRHEVGEHVVHYFERADPKLKPYDADKENIAFRMYLGRFYQGWHGDLNNWDIDGKQHAEILKKRNGMPTGWEDHVFEDSFDTFDHEDPHP